MPCPGDVYDSSNNQRRGSPVCLLREVPRLYEGGAMSEASNALRTQATVTRSRRLSVAVALLASSILATGASANDGVSLANWPAAPYWTAAATQPHGVRQALTLPSGPLPFVAISPCRQYDSRTGSLLSDNTPRTV